MTDARTGTVKQLLTLTQLTAICSQCYYSKWHNGGTFDSKICWCAGDGVCLHVCTSFNVWTRSCWFQYWMGVLAKWKLWQLIETNEFEAWQLNWEREGAKDGHTLCNDIILDKCCISAFSACKKTYWNVVQIDIWYSIIQKWFQVSWKMLNINLHVHYIKTRQTTA